MENLEKVKAKEPVDLDYFEGNIAGGLKPVGPDSFFRSALKTRLAQSKIYARRKAAGALSVIWLIAALIALVTGELIYFCCRWRGNPASQH